MFLSLLVRCGWSIAVVLLAVASTEAQGGRPATAPDTLVRQVRTSLGHGAVDEAERLINSTTAPPVSTALATSLVEIFQGRDDPAAARLKPLADANPLGDAALELGLLDIRRGRRDDGRRRLDPLASQRTFATPDDYCRLARAARGRREFLLADDGFQRVVSVARADIQTEMGDMFWQRHRGDLALLSYRAAIAADPAWVRAYLGVARVLADENPKAASVAFDTARKLAPDHSDVWLLRAERLLDAEDFPGTTDALDRLAKVKPGSIEEAALRGAVAYAERRPGDIEGAVARTREIDPTSARAYRLVGEQAAKGYRFDDAAQFARKATTQDPDDAAAAFDLGLYLLRTGDEKEARSWLEKSWTLDNSDRVTFNLLTMLDDLDKFEVIPTGDLVFKFARAEAAVLKLYALPLAADAYKTYVEHYGFTPKGPILVEVFPKHDDFAVRTIGLPGIEGALGACFGRVVSMDSPGAHPDRDFSWLATLSHELAHVFTLQLSDYRVPRWLTEGISVFEEYRRNPAWGRELTLEYAHASGRGEAFGVKKLPEAFKHSESLALAYFEASLVVEHLVELNGYAGLRTLLGAYSAGATDGDAFMKAYGKSLDDLDASFQVFVKQRYGALSEAMKDPPSKADPADLPALRARAAAAPGNFISQMTFGQALLQAGDAAGARVALERAARLAPQAMGKGSPHALLAQVALADGDRARARQELRALLTYDHTNVAAARRLAALPADAQGDATAAADEDMALRLVADLDPFDAPTHGLLGRRALARKELPTALVEFQAALALGPANLAEAHADVAEVFLKMNRRDEAKREALLALQEAPTYARAQDLLLSAIGKESREP